MRRFLLVTLLLSGAGCQAMQPCDDEACVRRKRLHGGLFGHCKVECPPPAAPVTTPRKDDPPADQKKSQPRPVVADPPAQAPVVANDILLVPKTVYVPYAPQTPVGIARISGAPINAPPPPQNDPPPAPVRSDPKPDPPKDPPKDPAKDPPPDLTRQMLDICKKLNDRLDCLEQRQKEIIVCPPTAVPVCPPPTPLFPLFRRPLFPRYETFQPCEPSPTPEMIAPPKAPPTMIIQ